MRSSGHLRFAASQSQSSIPIKKNKTKWTYSAKLIPLHLLWFPSAESAFIDQVWELLLHKLFDLGDCFLETLFAGTSDMEIERRVLRRVSTGKNNSDIE